MRIEQLRKLAGREVVDYVYLISMLMAYKDPRGKISEWLKSGDLIRVKKGLYIFGKKASISPYSREVLANLIYGPSAISLSYALSFYGFIPERVETVTSITNKRNKYFSTPTGEYGYQYLHPKKYAVGIEWVNTATENSFFIASPEKALCDYIHLVDKKISIVDENEIAAYLLHDLRIDAAALKTLRIRQLTELQASYQDDRLTVLVKFIRKWKAQHE